MNAAEFNALYGVGVPVFAYPGARPEDIPSAPVLVTRTRSEAQPVGVDREGVVWVEGHGAYIALTHVDVVSEDVWQAAKQAEKTAAAVVAEKEKAQQPADAIEYGIRIPDGSVLSPTMSRSEEQARLARYRDTWPDAVLVQRPVTYGEWTEAAS